MSPTDKIENLQRQVSTFIACGTREGLVVDTRRDRIYNEGQQPHFDTIIFDHWPEFELDCMSIRDARIQAGLK
ncbi:LOW QUALITY PROTEIN: hypothetical protein PHMEG_00012685 [Phytophthora megakarya]|uniref:Uncharacterized protein n=1 Tax=Phytophthora megakarya TaxID=4795 RepID=A0A225W9M6_9STRA|nr:LOW QUALITY PROTEIN: hypothetical protein PHMEG_00012685 [Phytophthora megakarya]